MNSHKLGYCVCKYQCPVLELEDTIMDNTFKKNVSNKKTEYLHISFSRTFSSLFHFQFTYTTHTPHITHENIFQIICR